MGEYADDEIDRWIGDCNWGRRGPRRLRDFYTHAERVAYASADPSPLSDFADLVEKKDDEE